MVQLSSHAQSVASQRGNQERVLPHSTEPCSRPAPHPRYRKLTEKRTLVVIRDIPRVGLPVNRDLGDKAVGSDVGHSGRDDRKDGCALHGVCG